MTLECGDSSRYSSPLFFLLTKGLDPSLTFRVGKGTIFFRAKNDEHRC